MEQQATPTTSRRCTGSCRNTCDRAVTTTSLKQATVVQTTSHGGVWETPLSLNASSEATLDLRNGHPGKTLDLRDGGCPSNSLPRGRSISGQVVARGNACDGFVGKGRARECVQPPTTPLRSFCGRESAVRDLSGCSARALSKTSDVTRAVFPSNTLGDVQQRRQVWPTWAEASEAGRKSHIPSARAVRGTTIDSQAARCDPRRYRGPGRAAMGDNRGGSWFAPVSASARHAENMR